MQLLDQTNKCQTKTCFACSGSKILYEPNCLRIRTWTSQENFSLHKSNRLRMNDQLYKTCPCHSVNVQSPKINETLPDNFPTLGIQTGNHGYGDERIWIKFGKSEPWQEARTGGHATISEQILSWQTKLQIAKPLLVDREGANNSKTFFSRWRRQSTFKKKNQEHKGQQKTCLKM